MSKEAKLEVMDDAPGRDDSDEVALAKFGRMHSRIQDLVKNKEATQSEIEKIAADVQKFGKQFEKQQEIKATADQALELAKAANATVPASRKLGGRTVEFIRALANGPKPDMELVQMARSPVPIDPIYFNLVGKPGKVLRELGADEETDLLLTRFRIVNDAIFTLNKIFALRDLGTYQEQGGMRSLALWKEWEELCKRIKLADLAEGSASTGGAWVPTIWSGNLIQLVQIFARCANYFETFPMQSLTHKMFVEGADVDARFISENNAITPTSEFTTFDATWTAKKMAAKLVTSRELTQDSAIPLTQEIERKAAKLLARGTENVIINSQTTGTTPGGAGSLDSGETIAAGDVRLMTNGIRYWHAQTGLGVKDAGAGLTIEACAKLRGPMGGYGTDPSEMVWICSAWGAAHILTVRTEDGRPVVLSPRPDSASPPGTIGMLLDSPVVLSAFVSDAMNSTGVIDGAGSTTAIYYVNTDQFKIGERMGIVVEASTHEQFSSDKVVFKAIRRFDFQPVRTPSATDPMVNAIGNLSLA